MPQDDQYDAVVTNARRQVLIEASIVEVQLSDDYQAGIDWAKFAEGAGFTLGAILTTSGGTAQASTTHAQAASGTQGQGDIKAAVQGQNSGNDAG